MSRYTVAYSSFIRRLEEVELLQQIALSRERADPIGFRYEINAFCRGGLVLLSAHLEGYVKEVGEIVLARLHANGVDRASLALQLYYHISKDLLDEIKDTSEPARVADKVFSFLQADLHYWGQVGPFAQPLPADRFNKGFSSPAFNKIRAYFNRFGYSDYKRDLARRLAAQFQVTINMVDHLVDTRNKIAHGDQTATKPPADLGDMIRIIRTYCKTTDQAFSDWCRANLCHIR